MSEFKFVQAEQKAGIYLHGFDKLRNAGTFVRLVNVAAEKTERAYEIGVLCAQGIGVGHIAGIGSAAHGIGLPVLFGEDFAHGFHTKTHKRGIRRNVKRSGIRNVPDGNAVFSGKFGNGGKNVAALAGNGIAYIYAKVKPSVFGTDNAANMGKLAAWLIFKVIICF